MARLLHGRPLAERIKGETRARAGLLGARGIKPTLAIVGLGGDPASHSYVQRLERSAADSGINTVGGFMPRETNEQQLIAHLERLSMDRTVNGILLLTPLPGALDEAHVIDHIAIAKDVEGMHPFNMGFLADVPLEGAHAVIVGRSTVIGRPAAYLLLAEDATVTIAHRQTRALEKLTEIADIVVVGVGRPAFLTGTMVKPGATVIDAGINMTPNGLAGDVELESVASVAGALSPVPGGLGAVTAALLLRNVVTATDRQTS